MAAASPCLWVSANEQTAFLKICGRATFTQSVDFKRFVHETLQRGYREFVLDLSDCLIMDSTFLGVLAGFGQKVAQSSTPEAPASVTLVNTNPRVAELLDNLGVASLFQRLEATPAAPAAPGQYEPATSAAPSKEELARTCLEAHETLMKLHAANIPKFKDVTRFFAEDLERLKRGSPEPPAQT